MKNVYVTTLAIVNENSDKVYILSQWSINSRIFMSIRIFMSSCLPMVSLKLVSTSHYNQWNSPSSKSIINNNKKSDNEKN
jgi:hypothetical protein